MAKSILPTAGVRDTLGSAQRLFDALYVKAIYGPNGKVMKFVPLDAGDIGSGVFNADRIDRINRTTFLTGTNPVRTIQNVSDDAATGASDPIARINAGAGGLNGAKISGQSINPNALNPAQILIQLLTLGNGSLGRVGGIESQDYVTGVSGFQYTQNNWEVANANAVFRGIVAGLIQMGFLNVDGTGRAVWNNPANPATGFITEADGRSYWGSDNYADAPLQMDAQGNIYVNETPTSLSAIDAGAITPLIKAVQPSQAGGQFSGLLTLTPLTRGATIFYTTDGSDPSLVTNGGRTKYVNPFMVSTGGGNVTVKAVAYKIGHYGPIATWVFTTSASQVAAPVFNPIPGYYTTLHATYAVTLATGTIGATIKYTTDGTDPSATNGTIYPGAINIPRPSANFTIKAYAFKPGLTDSPIVTGVFTIKKGNGDGGGGGNTGGNV